MPLSRIREKLAALRAQTGEDYPLDRALTERKIQAFEAKQGAQLPPEFRAFLRQIGASGAGPYGGLLPMLQWGAALGKEAPGWLSRPFPFAPGESGPFEPFGPPGARPFEGAIAISDQGCTFYHRSEKPLPSGRG